MKTACVGLKMFLFSGYLVTRSNNRSAISLQPKWNCKLLNSYNATVRSLSSSFVDGLLLKA
jgi:hypothetical protein